MSYCRCGDDSDVYVYQSFQSLVVHVAYNRGTIPEDYKGLPPNTLCGVDKFFTPIGLPSDGAEFQASSPEECITILNRLVEEGYKVPKRAFDRLRKDISGV